MNPRTPPSANLRGGAGGASLTPDRRRPAPRPHRIASDYRDGPSGSPRSAAHLRTASRMIEAIGISVSSLSPASHALYSAEPFRTVTTTRSSLGFDASSLALALRLLAMPLPPLSTPAWIANVPAITHCVPKYTLRNIRLQRVLQT